MLKNDEKLYSTNIYKSQSLYECAYLLAKGYPLIGKEKTGDKYTLFFKASSKLVEESLRFYNGGEAAAKTLFDSYRSLKDYIFKR